MPKIKIPRKSTWQDMTAMCDVAFLLLTFFILTSNMVQVEAVKVAIPSSISEIKILETNIVKILIDPQGKIFYEIDGQEHRMNLLKKMGEQYNVTFTDKELREFSIVPSFGVPMSAMKSYLAIKAEDRSNKENLLGIPCDSTDNQLKYWIGMSLAVNPKILISIKADQSTPFPVIKKVFGTLQDLKQNRFNLITSLEENPIR